jgi:hypothetical protein
MKMTWNLKKFVTAALAAVLLLTTLSSAALAADDLVRFRVENRDDRGITIRLYANDGTGRVYYMRVEGESTKVMTPVAGVYEYRLTACGVMVKGSVDLSKPLNWVMPKCGDKGGPGTSAANTQDVSKILKLVKMRIVNRTGGTLKIWFEGPFQYVFVIRDGGSKTVSLLKGEYEWGHFACGDRVEGTLDLVNTTTRTFTCD